MINPFHDVNWSPSKQEVRKLGLTLIIGFAVLAVLIASIRYFQVQSLPAAVIPGYWLLGVGTVMGACCFALAGSIGLLVYKLWYLIGCSIGIVVSNLLLLIFFYGVFSPFAIIARTVSGRDPLQLSEPTGSSNWHRCKPIKDLKRYFKQY